MKPGEMSSMDTGPGRHKSLNHIIGAGVSREGKHRSSGSPDTSAPVPHPALNDAQFSGIKGAGFSQYPKLGSEALDQTYKKARGI